MALIENIALRIQKALQGTPGGRGVYGTYVPGVRAQDGQPNSANPVQITPERMREIAFKTPTIAGGINAILDYTAGVNLTVSPVVPGEIPPTRARKTVELFLNEPNPQESARRFRRKLYRDIQELGYGFVEIERNSSGGVANLWVLDAARVKVNTRKSGVILGYTMLDEKGTPIPGDGEYTWRPDDIIFFQLDPVSESAYPRSRTAELFALGVIETLMLSYIGGRFTDSNVPFGMLDLGELTEEEIEAAIALWNTQLNDSTHPEHRIMFTGSRGGANWIPFGYDLQKLEAPEILSRVRLMILGILGVTVNELGESDNVNKSQGYNLSYTFKKRTIEPLLMEVAETLTLRLLHQELGYTNIRVNFEDIDSRDELLQSEIDKLKLGMGLMSINEVRQRDGQPDEPGGDIAYVIIGVNAVPVKDLQKFADLQMEALQVTIDTGKVAIEQAQLAMQQQIAQMSQPGVDPTTGEPTPPAIKQLSSLPIIRGAQPPEKFTTPLGSGSSTTKFSTPAPQLNTKPEKGPNPTATGNRARRGPREQNKQQGNTNE